jgi:putative FmdB family regulatory protein
MPTYEYACRDCGEHLEVVQSFKDEPLTVCGACGGALRKVFSAAGIIFKGSGYYVTDTRKKAGAGSTASGSSGASSGAGASESKPADSGTAKDSKPASTSGSSGSSGSSGAGGSSSEAKSA